MNSEAIRSCVKYFEKVTMNQIKEAHAFVEHDEIELTNYAKDLVDKKLKRNPLQLTDYAEYILNKNCNDKI